MKRGWWRGVIAWGLLAPSLLGAGEFYVVEQVEVTTPQEGKGSPRLTAMEEAKRAAFPRLLERMLPAGERSKAAKATEQGRKEATRLVERVAVSAERQRGAALWMQAEVTFNGPAVRELLEQSGLRYTESLYPAALLLKDEGAAEGASAEPWSDALSRAAAKQGIVLLQSMGDVEDLGHLEWNQAKKGDPELLRWVEKRYGTNRLWLFSGEGKGIRLWEVSDAGVRAFNQGVPAAGAGDREENAARLVRQVLEPWIEANLAAPDKVHEVMIHLTHEGRLPEFNAYLARLRRAPGVADLRIAAIRSHEMVVSCRYQGEDAQLAALLGRMGGQAAPGPEPGEFTVKWP
ncbi:MAG: DUF2066 domain-containing protein [Magnetococcales bacterium]|nr:DUF2066 domain-containing protein [Magnetococcales bacterium]